jgi:hypothetical protein
MWDGKPRDIECANEIYLDDLLPIVGFRLFHGSRRTWNASIVKESKVPVLLPGVFPGDQGFASILRDGLAKIAEVFQVLDAVTQQLQLAVDLFQGQRLGMIGLSNPIVICVLFLAAALLRHRVYQHAQWRGGLLCLLIQSQWVACGLPVNASSRTSRRSKTRFGI